MSDSIYIKSLLGGMSISIGGLAFLSVGGGVLGAFLFSIGLVSICVFDYRLFTGFVCSVGSIEDAIDAIAVLVGNMLGAILCGAAIRMVKPEIIDFAHGICEKKLDEGMNVVLLGMFCNVLIFFAVTAWKRMQGGGVPIIVLCVMVFILAGTEHSIANMFYFTVGGSAEMSGRIIWYIPLNVLSNALGGIGIYRLTKGNQT